MSKTTIYLVRHGQADWNVERRLIGHTDRPLTDLGRKQAKELAETLSPIRFDSIYSSDLSRARETAEIIATLRNLPVTTDPRFREKSFGPIEGISHKEMEEIYKEWGNYTEEQKWNISQAGEETNIAAATRALSVLQEVGRKEEGKTILIATHGGFIRFLLIKLGVGDFDKVGGIDNCGYVKLIFSGGTFTVAETVGLRTWKEKH